MDEQDIEQAILANIDHETSEHPRPDEHMQAYLEGYVAASHAIIEILKDFKGDGLTDVQRALIERGCGVEGGCE